MHEKLTWQYRSTVREKKTTGNNLVGRKTWKFYSGGEKWEMLVATKVKISDSEKQKGTGTHKTFPP